MGAMHETDKKNIYEIYLLMVFSAQDKSTRIFNAF